MTTVQIAGNILNLLGTLVLAFSVVKNPHGMHGKKNDGKKDYWTIIDTTRFRSGVLILLVGFALPLIENFIK